MRWLTHRRCRSCQARRQGSVRPVRDRVVALQAEEKVVDNIAQRGSSWAWRPERSVDEDRQVVRFAREFMPGQERAAAITRAAASGPPTCGCRSTGSRSAQCGNLCAAPKYVRSRTQLETDAASRGRVGGHADRTAFAGRRLPQTVGRDQVEEAVGGLPDDLDAELPYG